MSFPGWDNYTFKGYKGIRCLVDLFLGLGLADVFAPDLDPGLEEGLGHLRDRDAQEVGNLLGDGVVEMGGLVFVSILSELHVAEQKDGRDGLENG